MVSLSNGELCNGVSNKRFSEEVHSSSSITPKWKTRRVSAVRDFPPGCGPNAPRIKAEQVEDEKKMDVSAIDGVMASENGNEPLFREEVKSPTELEMAGSLDDLVGKVVASAAMTVTGYDASSPVKPLGDDFWQTLQIDAPEFSHDFDRVEALAVVKMNDTLENNFKVEISALADEPRPPSNGKLPLVLDLPISDGNIVKDRIMETKYPRRRVSATREFPPFCGRNAPCPTEEERTKIMLGASDKAPQQGADSLEMERGKKEEPEAEVKDGNQNIEKFEKVVRKVKTETLYTEEQGGSSTDMLRSEVDASLVSETRRSGFIESHVDVRESNFLKRKLEVRAPDRNTKSDKVNQTDYKGGKDARKNVSKEIVVFADKSVDINQTNDFALGCDADGEMMQGLIAGPSSPLRHVNKEEKMKYVSSRKIGEVDNLGGRSAKKGLSGKLTVRNEVFIASDQGEGDNPVGRSSKKRPSSSKKIAVRKKGLVAQEQDEVSHADHGVNEVEVTLPPFGPSSSSGGNMRNKVRETLRLFQAICRKILQGEEANSKQTGKMMNRIDLEAAKIIKTRGKEVNTGSQIIGAVPGVEVGDEFQYRVELALIGVHRLYQAGIDYMMDNGMIICVSIVASGGYPDELNNPDTLIYSGQGGMPGRRNKEKQAEDQKLERGNLALKNSIKAKNPIRVIRGTKEKVSKLDARSKMVPSYAYDGLYIVEKYWQEVGHKGKLVFKFELRRIPGQPELAWKEVKKSKKFKSREGVCVDDVSNGKEVFRICAVNTIDNEKPPAFNYTTGMIYPSWHSPTPPEGCDCVDGCSDSRKCLCVVKNGGEIPYNHNGAIVEAKPLVHECGPSCKCPPSCHNRVTQHGMKIQLEIFKTVSRGWGVRSLSSIPSGSFICEYIGELLDDKEAELRRNDEYLFDIGQNYTDCSQHMSSQMSSAEVAEDSGFTIDAAVYGNVGRFINHSCSPNLYAQNVLYDHEDKIMPHIMLFAAENIPPLQELTYHYNYSVDQVRDSNGNVKMKSCYCGSEECTGRMY